jgi:hypothetical protein
VFKIEPLQSNRTRISNNEFVAMVKQGRKDLKDGKGITITMDELEKFMQIVFNSQKKNTLTG